MAPVIGLLGVALVSTSTGGDAAIVPTVVLGTAAADAVLAGTTVTDTGASVVDGSANSALIALALSAVVLGLALVVLARHKTDMP